MANTVRLKGGTSRVSVADALRLVHEATRGGFVNVYAAPDGEIELRTSGAVGPFRSELKAEFLAYCGKAEVQPSSPFDRWRADYTGERLQDGLYEVSIDEFRRFAEAYGLTIEIAAAEAAPPATSDPVPAEGEAVTPAAPAIDYSLLAEPQELVAAFKAFTGMEEEWFTPVALKETPKLKAARKFIGIGGKNGVKPLFCPFEVMAWLIDPKRRKGSRLAELKGWKILASHFPMVHTKHSAADPN